MTLIGAAGPNTNASFIRSLQRCTLGFFFLNISTLFLVLGCFVLVYLDAMMHAI